MNHIPPETTFSAAVSPYLAILWTEMQAIGLRMKDKALLAQPESVLRASHDYAID